jgi:hypothetical protein
MKTIYNNNIDELGQLSIRCYYHYYYYYTNTVVRVFSLFLLNNFMLLLKLSKKWHRPVHRH